MICCLKEDSKYMWPGSCRLCQKNLENNRCAWEYKNHPGIIGEYLSHQELMVFKCFPSLVPRLPELPTYLAATNGTSVSGCMVGESCNSATVLVYWLSGYSFAPSFF